MAEAGTWYRVALNTIVRKGVKLDSERLRILPMGSRVCVVEQIDRRVRICQPVNGWCSIKSSNGDVILTKLDKQDQAAPPSTPKIRQEKANIEQQMSEILKEHTQIKAEFEKQKKGKENKLTEALQSLTNQHKEKDNEIQEAKILLSRLEDLNAELKMKELKMQEQKAIISQLKGPMGDEPSQNEKDMKRIYRVDDVVSLTKKVGGGLGIVKYYAEEDGVEIVGVQFSGPMNHRDPEFNGEPHFQCDPGCGAYIKTTHIKKYVTSEELLKKLNNQVARLVQLQSSGE